MKARVHLVKKNQRLQRSQVSSCALLLGCYMAPSLKAQSTEQVAAHGLPPNKLNCTVILVAMDPSQNPATSWAAKMLSGLCLQQASR